VRGPRSPTLSSGRLERFQHRCLETFAAHPSTPHDTRGGFRHASRVGGPALWPPEARAVV